MEYRTNGEECLLLFYDSREIEISSPYSPVSWIARAVCGCDELQDIHYGNARSMSYGPTTALGTSPFHPILHRSVSWGVGSATAGQKLYITRAIHLDSALSPDQSNEISSPPTAVVIPTLIVKEPDLHYIDRLRRSYVIQPTVD